VGLPEASLASTEVRVGEQQPPPSADRSAPIAHPFEAVGPELARGGGCGLKALVRWRWRPPAM
jgi:hypothetical protein